MVFKNKYITTVMLLGVCAVAAAQEHVSTGGKPASSYNFLVNRVPDSLNAPAIGFVNLAKGNHRTFQLGLFNRNELFMAGLQFGLINHNGGTLYGAQVGLFNRVREQMDGSQSGLLNFTLHDKRGYQQGLLNLVNGYMQGVQQGLINYVGMELQGIQLGMFNTVARTAQGVQIGLINNVIDTQSGVQIAFINTSFTKCEGLQIAALNFTKALYGCQIGLFNYVDSTDNGVPIGLVSFVRQGGYHALDAAVTENAALQFSFKMGVKKFYTSFIAALMPNNKTAFGVGCGSIVPLGGKFIFNPELNGLLGVNNNYMTALSFVPSFGWQFGHFAFTAGLSVSYRRALNGRLLEEPLFSLAKHVFDPRNQLILGAKTGIRFSW